MIWEVLPVRDGEFERLDEIKQNAKGSIFKATAKRSQISPREL